MGEHEPDPGPKAEELTSLYQRPLEEFVSARNQLATHLAAEGRKQAAAQVRRISRPSPALWAINSLAREAAGEIAELLEVGARLRRSQSRVMGGDRQAVDTLRSLGEEQRRILGRLRERAAQLLAKAGHAASEATLRRVETSLRSAAVADEDVRRAVVDGRLGTELAPTGFVELPVLSVVPDPDAAPDKVAEQRETAPGEDQQRALVQAEAAAAEARRTDARQRLRMAELELAEKEAAARRTRDASQRATDRLRRVGAEL
ncbi:MAG: hypothetical protein WCB85_06160, partial [Candidatus Dormiibacterota bacterium]